MSVNPEGGIGIALFIFLCSDSDIYYTESGAHMTVNVMRKRDFCLCENKGTDQHHSNWEADQHLCLAKR